ncbi:MAG: hypothetical protein Q8S73_12255 [Deltaproteobacteria bacterium]|nr:hypothetical protein [Myxococcales bacterium]MDP3214871.1 hypothetical protein [Deltaproteobacteria bacterium]
MTDPLVVCAGCYRHVRSSERACPFCAATLGAPAPASRPGALHTAVIAAALALAVSDLAYAQQNPPPPGNPRLSMEHGGAEGYGAPPMRDPMHPGPARPQPVVPAPSVEDPLRQRVAPLIELSRQSLNGARPNVAPGTDWTTELVIRPDGTFFSAGRSGQLTPPQLTALRAAIARTRLRLVRRRAVDCARSPDSMLRVTAGRADLRWAPGCEPTPDPSVPRLITLARRLTTTRRR